MRFSIFQQSELGARTVNQDRMGYSFTTDALLMVLCDGMGGHSRGEVAAEVAMRTIGQAFQALSSSGTADPGAFLDSALRAAHRAILGYQRYHQMLEAPRTTVVVCFVQDGKAWWAHAGDSRLYLVRKGRVAMRTKDHSKVQSLVSLGLLTVEQAEIHPERNKVLNCLGAPAEPTIELSGPIKLELRDILFLCSDGVWSELPEVDLVACLSRAGIAKSIPELVKTAVLNGGRHADNTTALGMLWAGTGENFIPEVPIYHTPEGSVTTTIMMAMGEEEQGVVEPIDDEDIERTIAEIQSAIARSGPLMPSGR